MPNFNKRSYQAELLDAENIPQMDLYQNLRELDFINTYLGGHECVIESFENIISLKYSNNSVNINNNDNSEIKINSISRENTENNINIENKNNIENIENNSNSENIDNNINIEFSNIIEIYEIGSGGGDNLNALERFFIRKGHKVKLTGIDMKRDCIEFAQKTFPRINFIENDYRKVQFENKPDYIFNSLFCHHFTDEQLVEMFRWMHKNSKKGFVVCDLHRHPLAYYSIKLLTFLFSKSYLVKNDAPLSVLRGFNRSELKELLAKAGIRNYSLKWKWAFRWSLLVYN